MSDYVRKLRAKIGHDLLFSPAVACLIRDDDDRMLLVRQAGDATWSLPAGAIDPGETPADAVRREVREEASVDVELLRLAGVFGGGPSFRRYYANGDEVAWVTITFEARIVAGVPAPDDEEIAEVRWATAAELETLDLMPSTRHILACIDAGRGFDP